MAEGDRGKVLVPIPSMLNSESVSDMISKAAIEEESNLVPNPIQLNKTRDRKQLLSALNK
eukprot:6153822-Amphidinium_carterae.1